MHCTLVIFSFEHDFGWAFYFHSLAKICRIPSDYYVSYNILFALLSHFLPCFT